MRLTKPQKALLRDIAAAERSTYVAPTYKPIDALLANHLVRQSGRCRYVATASGRDWLAANPQKEAA